MGPSVQILSIVATHDWPTAVGLLGKSSLKIPFSAWHEFGLVEHFSSVWTLVRVKKHRKVWLSNFLGENQGSKDELVLQPIIYTLKPRPRMHVRWLWTSSRHLSSDSELSYFKKHASLAFFVSGQAQQL